MLDDLNEWLEDKSGEVISVLMMRQGLRTFPRSFQYLTRSKSDEGMKDQAILFQFMAASLTWVKYVLLLVHLTFYPSK